MVAEGLDLWVQLVGVGFLTLDWKEDNNESKVLLCTFHLAVITTNEVAVFKYIADGGALILA